MPRDLYLRVLLFLLHLPVVLSHALPGNTALPPQNALKKRFYDFPPQLRALCTGEPEDLVKGGPESDYLKIEIESPGEGALINHETMFRRQDINQGLVLANPIGQLGIFVETSAGAWACLLSSERFDLVTNTKSREFDTVTFDNKIGNSFEKEVREGMEKLKLKFLQGGSKINDFSVFSAQFWGPSQRRNKKEPSWPLIFIGIVKKTAGRAS